MLVVVVQRGTGDPRLKLDAIGDEAHRTVAQREVGAAGVQTGISDKTTRRTGQAPIAAGQVRIVQFGMRSSSDHRIAYRSSAWRVSHTDPRRGIANLRVALAEHDRVTRTVGNVLVSFCINLHENSPTVWPARGISSIVRSTIA